MYPNADIDVQVVNAVSTLLSLFLLLLLHIRRLLGGKIHQYCRRLPEWSPAKADLVTPPQERKAAGSRKKLGLHKASRKVQLRQR